MSLIRYCAAMGFLYAAGAAPAFADDCKPVTDSIIVTVKTPYKMTLTRTGKDGKPETNYLVQTPNAKYVQTGGRWITMPSSSQDLLDQLNATMKTAKMECHRLGTEMVSGQSAAIYSMHVENEGTVSDSKVWLSSDRLPLKSEVVVNGTTITSIYDYANVQPPLDAAPLGLPAPAKK